MIIQFSSGAVAFKCQHSHCAGRTWEDFKRILGMPPALDVSQLNFGPSPASNNQAEGFQLDLPRPALDACTTTEYWVNWLKLPANTPRQTRLPSSCSCWSCLP